MSDRNETRKTSVSENGGGSSGITSQARESSDKKVDRLKKLLHLLSSDIPELAKEVWKDLDNEQRQEGLIQTLKNRIDKLERENDGLLEQIQQLELKVSPTDRHYKTKNDQFEKQLEHEKRMRKEAEKNMQEEKTANAKLIQSFKDKLSKSNQEIEEQKKKTEMAENETRKAKADLLGEEEEIDCYKAKYKHCDRLEHQLQKTMDALKKSENELEDCRIKLSKQMGDKLTDKTPYVADLSDKNRPTKLAERYQEIYDNEWTDAYDILDKTKRNEQAIIASLNSILQEARAFCDVEADKQMVELHNALTQESSWESSKIPTMVNKQLKDCRKMLAEYSGKQIYEMYFKKLEKSVSSTASDAKLVPKFTEACVKICWLMTVQDPPVVLGPNIKCGVEFDSDQYKAYTMSGKKVMFVVWPALLLHVNGALLCKGIAQGEGNQRSKSDPAGGSNDEPHYDKNTLSYANTVAPVSDSERYAKDITPYKGHTSGDIGGYVSSEKVASYTKNESYHPRYESNEIGYMSHKQRFGTDYRARSSSYYTGTDAYESDSHDHKNYLVDYSTETQRYDLNDEDYDTRDYKSETKDYKPSLIRFQPSTPGYETNNRSYVPYKHASLTQCDFEYRTRSRELPYQQKTSKEKTYNRPIWR